MSIFFFQFNHFPAKLLTVWQGNSLITVSCNNRLQPFKKLPCTENVLTLKNMHKTTLSRPIDRRELEFPVKFDALALQFKSEILQNWFYSAFLKLSHLAFTSTMVINLGECKNVRVLYLKIPVSDDADFFKNLLLQLMTSYV